MHDFVREKRKLKIILIYRNKPIDIYAKERGIEGKEMYTRGWNDKLIDWWIDT